MDVTGRIPKRSPRLFYEGLFAPMGRCLSFLWYYDVFEYRKRSPQVRS
jgi:hypothetical protein